MLIAVTWWFVIVCSAEGMVLDPALYLAPSPPLVPAAGTPPALWWQPRSERDTNLGVIPIEHIKAPEHLSTRETSESAPSTTTPQSETTQSRTSPTTQSESTKSTTEQEMMEKSETFWPLARPTASTGPYLGIQGIHVPLTFSLTGNYGTGLGRYGAGASNLGVIGSSYASVDTEDSGLFRLYGKSALAGSSYGSYGGYGGTRIYGSGGGAAWSGWGNGKWGHYGKG